MISGYIIQYSHPKYVYLLYSFMGMFVSFSGLCLSPVSERDATENEEDEVDLTNIRGNIFKDLKTIFKRIKEALMMKEIYMLLLFFILNGLISPGFGNFSYYFLMNVCKITKVQYSLLATFGSFTGLIGVIIYEKFCKDIEVRQIVWFSIVMSCLSGFCDFGLAKRWNLALGISDLAYLYTTSIFFGIIGNAISFLPLLSLFAKIVPKRVEGTLYAFMTGAMNLSGGVLAPMVGVYINDKFVGVTSDNLKGYSTLCLISFILTFATFILLPLIPTND